MKTVIAFVGAVAVGFAGMAAESAIDFSFDAPEISLNGAGGSVVAIPGCGTRHVPGEARLPFLFRSVPFDGEVISVRWEGLSPVVRIPVDAPVEIAGTPVAMDGGEPALRASFGGGSGVERGGAGGAPDVVEFLGVRRSRRGKSVMLRINPVGYDVENGELVFHPDLRVFIESEGEAAVFNEATVRGGGGGTADYLLVTSAAFTNAFAPFVAMKEQRHGLNVIVSVIEDVLATSPGADGAERLRNHIRDVYEATDIRYVLLGGASPIVPHRSVWCRVGTHSVTNVPTDMYYACLDGTWNGNGAMLWGEPGAGENGAEIDMAPEIAIGRVPAANVGEVENFVEKCLRYEYEGHSGAGNALFFAEHLGGVLHGGRALDFLLTDFAAAGYGVGWLDDRPADGAVWSAPEAVAKLESPERRPHIVAHYGHASRLANMRIPSAQAGALGNEFPFLAVSAGCDSGAFDNSDFFARQVLCGGAGGAFAGVYNSRFGWFDNANEGVYSGEYMTKFFKRLLVQDRGAIGDAFISAKNDMLGQVEDIGKMGGASTNLTYRWLWFDITLFGDPHAALKPDSMIMAQKPPAPAAYSGYMGGIFAPDSEYIFTVANCVTSGLPVAVSAPAFLTMNDMEAMNETFGSPGPLIVGIPGDSSSALSFFPSAAAYSMPPGTYAGSIVFSNTVSARVDSHAASFTVSPNIRFQTAAITAMEGAAQPAPLVVQRLDSALAPVGIDYAALSGTAVEGADFAQCAGTLVFGAGEKTKQIQLVISDDEIAEPEKTFTVSLSNPQGSAALAAQSNVVVTLLDNDHLARFDISAVPSPQRAGRPFELQLTARNLTGGVLTQYAGEPLLYAADYSTGEYTDEIYFGELTAKEYPFYHNDRVARTQVIYTSEEIGGAGLLTGIALWQYQRPAKTLSNWTIRVKHTALSSFASPNNAFQPDGWTTVHNSDMPAGPYVPFNIANPYYRFFPFDPPFAYDGASNLMVDFSTRNKSSLSGSGGYVVYSDYPVARTLRGQSNDYNHDPLTWNGPSPAGFVSWNAAPFAFFERYQALPSAPARAAEFSGGISRGNVHTLTPCANTVLMMGDPAKGKGDWQGTYSVTAPPAGFDAPPAWLAFHGLTADDWLADSDGDGVPNRHEWLAGTDPLDAQSLFIAESPNLSPGGFELRWRYAPGRTYAVERARSLESGFDTIKSNIAAGVYTDAITPADTNGFYRVRIE